MQGSNSPRMPSPARIPSEGIKRKIVVLVFFTAVVTALIMSGISSYSTYSSLRQRVDETHSLALTWSREWVRGRLDRARAELEEMALREALLVRTGLATRADPVLSELLDQMLSRSKTFSGLVVLDRGGEALGAAGSGPVLEGLLRTLERKNALDAELVEVMRTAQLRKELGGVEAPSLRVADPGGTPPLPLASVPIHDRQGLLVGSIHGLIRRRELASRLRADPLGASGNILLASSDGRIVAAGRELEGASRESLAPEVLRKARGSEPHTFWSSDGWTLTSVLPLGAHDWTLVVEQPVREAYGPLLLAGPRLLVAGAVLVVCFTLLASRVASAMVRPLWALFQGIRGAARGDLGVAIPVAEAEGELESVILAFNEMARRLSARRNEIETSHRALQEQHQAFQHQYETLSKLSVTDTLTQLNNRRFFNEQLEREVKRMARNDECLSLLIIDIDDFKKLNDCYGHAAGDEFLRQVARILKETVRTIDLLARYGGEEFVVVAVSTDLEGGVILGEKVRTAIAEASFIVDDTMRPRRATISIGVSQYRGSRTDLFNSADAALYRAKAEGKNCVVPADEPGEQG